MRNSHKIIIFCLILALGVFLRAFLLGKVPISPDWDEVALGYNAYSIMQTGKDEYGDLLPIVLRSYNDYKPALYAYLIIPFLKIFDLNVIAVRLPSIIFGCIGIIAVYFIVKELFENDLNFRRYRIKKEYLALISMFLFSISPWHIQFSRVGYEANVGLTVNLLSTLFFLKAFKKNHFLVLSLLFASLNLYVYQSEKVYGPLLVLVLLFCFWKQFISISRKWISISLVTAILVALPMGLYVLTNPNALTRAKGVSVFTDTRKLLESNTVKIERDRAKNDYIGMIIDNRRIEYVKAFTAGYLSHFEPNWLFYRGDEVRHHAPYMGLLYLFELPFVLLGTYVLLFSNVGKNIKYFIVSYVLIAPIPASITIDVPHAVRTINFLPAPQILASIGLLAFFYYVRQLNIFFRIALIALIFTLPTLNITYYLNQYFVQMNYYYSKGWQYGWEEAVKYASEKSKSFDHVVVTNVSPLDQSYMFFLYYLKYDPKKYLAEGGTKSGSFNDEHAAFEKFSFRPINWEKDKFMKRTLFVGLPSDLPDNRGKIINYLDGEPAIVFSERHD